MDIRKTKELCDTPLYRKMSRCAEIDDIRQANAAKRSAVMGKALRLDDCLKDDHGKDRENRLMSDRGRGAADIRKASENELWLDLFNAAYDSLPDSDKVVVDALFQDLRPAAAARIANTNRQHVYRVIDRFSEKLVPAYLAWKMRDRV